MQSTAEERIVIYIDVVGWRHAFDTIGHDALLAIAREIADHKAVFTPEQKAKLRAWEQDMTQSHGMRVEGGYHEINFSFVSDSLILSAPIEHMRGLLGVAKWACMRLLGDHGFLTRGGIAAGRFTHDMEHDIAIGRPLVEAAELEEKTSMPRVALSPSARQLIEGHDYAGLLYHDGTEDVLNIANGSDAWFVQCQDRIETALTSGLDERKRKKWEYMAEHLPKMASQRRAA